MNIPVLMYHGISDDITRVPYGFLLQPTDQFEACMKYLVRNGFNTITLHDLYAHLKSNSPIPSKSVVLTFDDGYLDNWVYVYPILKKYGLKGTIFVVTDFVDPEPGCRPNLDDVAAKRASREELKWWGYLSWAEMKRMEADGVMDIQAHTRTHTWYFNSDKIVDFHHPNDPYPWLAWNHSPEEKYHWVDKAQENFVAYGSPVYEYGRSLGIRRYFDDPGLSEDLSSFVKANGNEEFFVDLNWRNLLHARASKYKEKHPSSGRYETDSEYEDRLRSEIVDSKRILETNLQKEIKFLCWPGGAHTLQAYELALQNGYLATTKGDSKNAFGNDPSKLHRTGTYLDSRQYNMTFLSWIALPFFVIEIQSYRGQPLADFAMRAAGNVVRAVKAVVKLSKGSQTSVDRSH